MSFDIDGEGSLRLGRCLMPFSGSEADEGSLWKRIKINYL